MTPPRLLTAAEICALSDDALDRYLDDNRMENGDRYVEVEDPENIPDSFLQRLRDRVHTDRKAVSKPVDLDLVTARLLSSLGSGAAPRAATPDRCPTPGSFNSEDWRLEQLGEEQAAYDELVSAGGRPLYPGEKLPAVSQNPSEFRDMILPWLRDPEIYPDAWHGIFMSQNSHWRRFRASQEKFRRESNDGLRQFTEQARERLAAHSILRPIQFDPDPARQDQLTTWLEYLNYECLWAEQDEARKNCKQKLLLELRLPWLISQIDAIEAEMEEAARAAGVSSTAKRARHEDGASSGEETVPPPKRKKVAADVATPATRDRPSSPTPPETARAAGSRERTEPRQAERPKRGLRAPRQGRQTRNVAEPTAVPARKQRRGADRPPPPPSSADPSDDPSPPSVPPLRRSRRIAERAERRADAKDEVRQVQPAAPVKRPKRKSTEAASTTPPSPPRRAAAGRAELEGRGDPGGATAARATRAEARNRRA